MNAPTTYHFVRPAIVTAVAAGIFGLAIGALIAVIPWAMNPSGSMWTPLRQGAQGWLVVQGSGLQRDGIDINAIPLGALLGVVALIGVVTIKTVVDPVTQIGAFVATTTVVYGVGAGVVSMLSQTEATSTTLWRAIVGASCVAAAGSALGLAYAHPEVKARWSRFDPRVRAIVRSAATGAAGLLGVALVLFVVMLLAHADRAGQLWSALQPGFGGGVALVVLCLAVLPNLVLWGASALIGPGFELGTNTSVDLTGAHVGDLPGLPLLAALPEPGSLPGWVFLLSLLPILAGLIAGWRYRGEVSGDDWLHCAGYGALSGGLAGVIVGLLVMFSGGAVGPGRMANVGPPLFTPLLTAALVLALGGAMGALLGHYRGVRASARPS